MGYLSFYRESFAEHPVLTLLEVGTLSAVLVLPFVTVLLLVQGVTPGNEPVWIAVVVASASIVLVWNVLYPVYDRYFTAE